MEELLWFMLPAKYQAIIGVVAVAGWFMSEALSLIPAFKSNGICQLIANTFRSLARRSRPDIIPQAAGSDFTGTIPLKEEADENRPVVEPSGVTEPQSISSPEANATAIDAP